MLTFMLESSIDSETNSWEKLHHPPWVPSVHALGHFVIPASRDWKRSQGIFALGSLTVPLPQLESKGDVERQQPQ